MVDFANHLRLNQKLDIRTAIEQAAAIRLRPILMTSISTIAGMMPIALQLGADGEVRSPMAIAVIGGFTTSTLLNRQLIGWAHGDFAPQAFHTTGHAVFRIRRLNPAQVNCFSQMPKRSSRVR